MKDYSAFSHLRLFIAAFFFPSLPAMSNITAQIALKSCDCTLQNPEIHFIKTLFDGAMTD